MAPPGDAGGSPPASGAVRVEVFETSHYCGGAAPPPELARPVRRPLGNATFLVRSGTRNTNTPPVVEVTTDANGRFDLDVPAGTYCIVRDYKRSPGPPVPPAAPRTGHGHRDRRRAEPPRPAPDPNYDAARLARVLETCDAVFSTPAPLVTIELDHTCAGDGCYHGPPPP